LTFTSLCASGWIYFHSASFIRRYPAVFAIGCRSWWSHLLDVTTRHAIDYVETTKIWRKIMKRKIWSLTSKELGRCIIIYYTLRNKNCCGYIINNNIFYLVCLLPGNRHVNLTNVNSHLDRCKQGWNDLNQLIKISDLNRELD